MEILPHISEIRELAATGRYNVAPVSCEMLSDFTTPIETLRILKNVSAHCYLLESAQPDDKWGRYTFLGFDPKMEITCIDGEMKAGNLKVKTDRPSDYLRQILADYKSPRFDYLPSFTGGLVGYFSYDYLGYSEPAVRCRVKDTEAFKDVDLMLFDKVIAYDHLRQKICLIVNMKTDKVMENYGKAAADLEAMAEMIGRPMPQQERMPRENVKFTCNVSKEEYCRAVERAKEYIRAGDIFQAVISRQFQSPYQGSLLNAYRVLRTTNPSPYMVYMKIGGQEIMSSSPETLVRLNQGRLVSFPVAGSRPRGKTLQEDLALERELLQDEKELAEHNMLVDLGRNDLGKISEFNSVAVTQYQMIHRYSRIMHICSQVEGDIRKEYDGLDAVEAVLPAGTLSGAPKIRACQIIEELEGKARGIYGGALGYLDFTGNLDTCIAIRMAVKKDGIVYVQAGGGIVADSVPEMEYEESANKAMAVIQAVEQAQEVEESCFF